MEIKDIRGISNISGMPKGYEDGCQKMLQAGFEWLEKNKKADLKAHTLENVYGIFTPDSEDAKKLSDVVGKAVEDCTGAMHQAVMQHLFYIAKNGIEKWKKEVKT